MNEKSRQVAYTNVTQEDYVMAEPDAPHPVVEVPCGIQFCSSKHPFAVMEQPKSWHCGAHRWPGGQGDPSLEVEAMGAPATFVNGVEYVVTFGGSLLNGRVVGRFDLNGSGDGRLLFRGVGEGVHMGGASFVNLDPDAIEHVVAL